MEADLATVPLAALTKESRILLSDLLNPRKVLPIVGPDQLSRHRDWRGLASLVNISSELAASINDCNDKTAKVLEIWENRNDGTATIGRLLVYLQILDRYDLHDDILERASLNQLLVQSNDSGFNQVCYGADGYDEDLITFDDKMYGRPQMYQAYVLYSENDKIFVDELLYRMRSEGYKMCTEEDLRAGHATKFEPISRLITERCRYIILIYSPDFLQSPAIKFYMNLAQADAINKKMIKIIPVMYRQCTLPSHIAHYHGLRYRRPGPLDHCSFWDRLAQSLRTVDRPRINGINSVSNMDITEITKERYSQPMGHSPNFLALPDVHRDSSSLNDLDRIQDTQTYDRKLSNSSQTSESEKKKSGPFNMILTFGKKLSKKKGKKHKNEIALEN